MHGRTNGETDPLTLFWTASGLEVNVRGGELWVELSADWSMYEPWYSFVVNGEFLSRRMAEKGTHRVCVFRGMNRNRQKCAHREGYAGDERRPGESAADLRARDGRQL